MGGQDMLLIVGAVETDLRLLMAELKKAEGPMSSLVGMLSHSQLPAIKDSADRALHRLKALTEEQAALVDMQQAQVGAAVGGRQCMGVGRNTNSFGVVATAAGQPGPLRSAPVDQHVAGCFRFAGHPSALLPGVRDQAHQARMHRVVDVSEAACQRRRVSCWSSGDHQGLCCGEAQRGIAEGVRCMQRACCLAPWRYRRR